MTEVRIWNLGVGRIVRVPGGAENGGMGSVHDCVEHEGGIKRGAMTGVRIWNLGVGMEKKVTGHCVPIWEEKLIFENRVFEGDNVFLASRRLGNIPRTIRLIVPTFVQR